MPESTRDAPYDLFISYAHKDNEGPFAGRVTALKQWIEGEFARIVGRPLQRMPATGLPLDAFLQQVHRRLGALFGDSADS